MQIVHGGLFQRHGHRVSTVGVVCHGSLNAATPGDAVRLARLGENLHHVAAHRPRVTVPVRRLQLQRQRHAGGAAPERVAAQDAPVGVTRPRDHLQHPRPPGRGAIADERGDGVRAGRLQRRGKGADCVEGVKRRLRWTPGGYSDSFTAGPPCLVPGRIPR